MKILSNKNYGVLVDRITKLEKEKELIEKKYNNKDFKYLEEYDKYRNKCDKLEEANKYHQKLIEVKDKDIEQISEKLNVTIFENRQLKALVKEVRGSKGGLTCRVNKLTSELKAKDEKIKQLEEELSKRYTLKELKPVKPKAQKMMLKSSSRQSNAIKLVKEKC